MPVVRFQADALRARGVRVFVALGTPEDIAGVVAGSLVDANLAGHDSHGVLRIPSYVERVRDGAVSATARPRVVTSRQATALLSGEWGFGQMTGQAATDEAVQRAREYGIGAVGAVRCNHLGRIGEYVERAAGSGCAAIVCVGGLRSAAVPHGGSRPALGTNPLAAGFPVRGEDPLVLDFATTSVAAGKIMAARAAGKQLPPGCIVDSQGRPTTSPAEYFNGGALLPFGGHKGYALSVLIEMLGQALTGADAVSDVPPGDEAHRYSGALFCAVDVGAFRPAGDAQAVAKDIVERLRAVPPAPGSDRVLTPGEPEAHMRRHRAAAGIEIAEETWRAIVTTATQVGLSRADLPHPVAVA
jgi:hydroxycarboxylate dehydrogenase B